MHAKGRKWGGGARRGGGERVPGRNRDLKQAEQLRIATSKKKKPAVVFANMISDMDMIRFVLLTS